jgi:hypothetical protein
MRLLTGGVNDNERSYAAALVPSGSTLYGAAMVTANGTIFKNQSARLRFVTAFGL